ncbi:glutamyl-tRNA reductase [Lachnospiraceae bacterium]|nr:glutamyl-tRNA reductase [Lachnospiraceae bacterium]
MSVQMVGIDYEKANLDVRAKFSFQEDISDALDSLVSIEEIDGAVILSTCNRTEIYISEETGCDLKTILCELKGLPAEEYAKYMIVRDEKETLDHLFQLSCGMKSRVFGEDQIITQVKNALNQAREAQATDYELEKMFAYAIAVGKKVKTELHLTAVETSVVSEMMTALEAELGDLHYVPCMVIGNGEIGRLAANALHKAGADVMVTIRNYKTRQIEIPEGCRIVDYKDRYEIMGKYDVIVSATTSPHHTVKYEDCHEIFEDGKKRVLVDLAVPRDISSAFACAENVKLYNIDNLGGKNIGADNEEIAKAMELILEYQEKYCQSVKTKAFADMVHTIGQDGGELTCRRIGKSLKSAVEAQDMDAVERHIKNGVSKTVSAMMFAIQKTLPQEDWIRCMEAIDESMRIY